ncbi:hypothetical protein EHS25_005096 [Saitozyma podzolica]|uniref:ER membrane protein complex subunit 2 n=1 Tax=Saitozyma podzolica TaxID=1890683 RepID=A0A427Y2J4_9TREE|nr:hypothetical protein EHS25_005096 [Saitozyma podzolica]
MSQSELETLARWRAIGARHSEEVVELAGRVLKSGQLGDQEWSIREQLAIAALDLGKITLATDQLDILARKFAKSPRITLLLGLRQEAQGDTAGAKATYEALLKTDETNVSAYQRLIALSQTTAPNTTITLLLGYLDTFYTDPAGWSLLAELYADQGLYAQSLAALGHVMLINTWDSIAVCRAGETAYTMGDYQLALKHFLRATEMETPPSGSSVEGTPKSRSWWGVKLSLRRLLESKIAPETSVPPEMATTPDQLRALDELATERLLAVGGAGMEARRKVLAGGERVR